MDTIHRSLSRKVGPYKTWHKNPLHAAVHWSVFVFAILFTTNVMLTSISSSEPTQQTGAAVQSDVHSSVVRLAARGPVQGEILVKFKKNVGQTRRAEVMAKHNLKEKSEIKQIGVKILGISTDDTPEEVVQRIRSESNSDIEFAEVNATLDPQFVPNDPSYGSAWHLPKIGAPAAWDYTRGSVVMGIGDSGVDCTHPDLSGHCVQGYNFYDNNTDAHDVYGHGTWVAGIAAAALDNAIGSAGVCGECKIMPLRISDTSGYATWSTVSQALTYAADHGVKVINFSYQITGSATVSSAAQYLQSKGGVVTASAGNASTNLTVANDPYLITVSATNSSDALASWSNYGTPIDVSGPGDTVYTTSSGGGYTYVSGTSFSAPLTAAVLALELSVNPQLSAGDLESILKSSSDDLGAPGWDAQYGYGRINAGRAVVTACTYVGASCAGITASTTPTPTLSADGTAPSVPTGLTASSPDSTRVNLSWIASSDPTVTSAVTSGVASYKVYKGTALLSTTAQTSLSDTSVVAGGSYTYQVSAVDKAGNESAKSAAVSVAVPAASANQLKITKYSVSSKTGTSATVAWTTSVPTTGTVIYGTSPTALSLSVPAPTSSLTHSVTLTNLSKQTNYTYQISASDGSTTVKVQSSFKTSSR